MKEGKKGWGSGEKIRGGEGQEGRVLRQLFVFCTSSLGCKSVFCVIGMSLVIMLQCALTLRHSRELNLNYCNCC